MMKTEDKSMEKFTLQSCMMFTTNHGAKLFQSVLTQKLKTVEINYNTWLALYFINSNNKITQNNLAKLVGITGPSMVKIVEKMRQAGLVDEEKDEQDHRQKHIYLTNQGIEKYDQALKIVTDYQTLMTSGVSQSDLNTAATVINKMIENAQQELE